MLNFESETDDWLRHYRTVVKVFAAPAIPESKIFWDEYLKVSNGRSKKVYMHYIVKSHLIFRKMQLNRQQLKCTCSVLKYIN